MPTTSSSITTYESRVINSADSSATYAIFKVVTTTTTITAPDTPVGTTVTESLTFESVDYTPVYKDILNSVQDINSRLQENTGVLQNVNTSLSEISERAAGEGIKTLGVYDWVLLSSVFKMYVDDTTKENFIGRDKLEEYRDKINSLPKS